MGRSAGFGCAILPAFAEKFVTIIKQPSGTGLCLLAYCVRAGLRLGFCIDFFRIRTFAGAYITLEIMTSAIVIPVLLAVASGLSIIAFKTPKIFLRLAFPLIGLLLLVQAIVISWDIGFQQAFVVFLKFIPKEHSDAANLALQEHSIPWEFMLYVFCAIILIGFLYWLAHQVIERADDNEQKDKVNGK